MSARPISPQPVTQYQPHDIPPYVSNGVIGLRVPQFGFQDGTACVNGYVETNPRHKIEGSAFAPYPLAADIRLNTWWMSQRPDFLTFEEQRYDFHTGEVTTRFTYAAHDNLAHVEVLTFASRSLPFVVCQEVRVRLDKDGPLSLRCGIDPTGINGECLLRDTRRSAGHLAADGAFLWRSLGGLSRLGTAFFSELADDDTAEKLPDDWGHQTPILTTYNIKAQAQRTYTLRQYTSMVPDVMHSEPERQALRLAYMAYDRGFATVRRENQEEWAELWQGRPVLLGADTRWQQIADANFFYINTSIHKSSPCSTGLFGLSQYHNYHYFLGHQFWDLETFMVPPLILVQPKAAKTMLLYRSERLGAARKNAAMNGYEGAQFPWESSPSRGEEVTPNDYLHIMHEQHISMDIAFAFSQYCHATEDEPFLHRHAWPVLEGVAEWITSRVTKTERGYELRHIMGVTEGITDNNNIWSLTTTHTALREASALARHLGIEPPAQWQRIADQMYMPRDSDTNALRNSDERTDWLAEAAMAFYPQIYQAAPGVEQATYEQYLATHPHAQWPMCAQFGGVYAARLGQRETALQLLEEGCAGYMFGPFSTVDEFGATMTRDKEKVGPYMAHAGGFVMNLLYGFTGLRLGAGDPQSWFQFPVTMPMGWEGIEVERIWVRNRPARLVAHHGDERGRIEMLDSD